MRIQHGIGQHTAQGKGRIGEVRCKRAYASSAARAENATTGTPNVRPTSNDNAPPRVCPSKTQVNGIPWRISVGSTSITLLSIFSFYEITSCSVWTPKLRDRQEGERTIPNG